MPWFSRISIILLICPAILVSGCIDLATDQPRKDSYLLNVSREEGAPPAEPGGAILQIREFRVSPRYDDAKLIYRMDESIYVADHYNRFLVAPAVMISEEAGRWMESTDLFGYVLDRPGRLEPDYFLEGNVPVLYGDFTQDPPLAKMEIEFTLFRDLAAGPRLLLHRKYRRQVPLSEESPEALIDGFGEALETILTNFEQDLREKNLSLTP